MRLVGVWILIPRFWLMNAIPQLEQLYKLQRVNSHYQYDLKYKRDKRYPCR